MYHTVMAVVDETTGSELAARYAVGLARDTGAKLVLLLAVPPKTDRREFKRAENHMERLFLDCAASHVAVEGITETGSLLPVLEKKTGGGEVDLVFFPLRRTGRPASIFAARQLAPLLAATPAPIAVVRIVTMARPHPSNILVPLSGRVSSPDARARFIAALSRAFGATVTLYHLHRRFAAPREREKLPGDIAAFIDRLREYHVSPTDRSGRGHVGHGITTEAAARRSDLIVMGASERSILKTIVEGSPLRDVMVHTPCNLIIFKA